MAEITPYAPGPGSLANQVVGTPGVNHQAGQEWFKLADAAGQAREGVARNQMSAANQMFGILDSVAGAIGSAIGRHAFAQQKTNNMLNVNAVNDKVYQFEEALIGAENKNQQLFASQPQNAMKSHKSLIERNTFNSDGSASFADGDGNPLDIASVMRSARNDDSLKSDPKALAKLESDLTAAAHRSTMKMGEWSFKQRREITEASDQRIVDSTIRKLSVDSGPINTRLENYQNAMANAENKIAGNMEILGQPHVEKKLAELRKEAGFTYIDAGIANRPAESAAALSHLAEVKSQLANADKLGIEIDAKSKITLQGKIESAENYHMKELQNDALSDTVLDTAGIATRKAYLDTNSKSPAAQNQAKFWANDQIKVATKSISDVQANPSLDTKAKNTIIGRYAQQINMLGGVIELADRHLKGQESTARQIESDARRDAADVRRDAADARRIAGEERRETREEAAAAKAAFKEQAENTKSNLVTLQDELNQLMTDPVGNRQAIIEKGGELSAATDIARNANHITATQASKTLKGAVNVVNTAAQYKEKPGFLWMPSTVERIKPDSAKQDDLKTLQKRQSDYVGQMEKIRQQQFQEQQDTNINQMVRGMSPAQLKEFDTKWPLMQAELNKMNASQAVINQKKNLFISRVFERIPHKSPAQVPGGPKPPSGKDMVNGAAQKQTQGLNQTGGMKSPPSVKDVPMSSFEQWQKLREGAQ